MTLNELFSKVFEESTVEVDTASEFLYEKSIRQKKYSYNTFNLSNIASTLVNQAGRWCEHYASDVIITWDEVRHKINEHVTSTQKTETDAIAFGFRLNGVDSNSYIYSRFRSDGIACFKEYIHIFVVQIEDEMSSDGKTVHVTLKNVDNSYYRVLRDNIDKCH